MTLIEFVIFIFVGCITGFIGGLFGVGGGFIMVPALIFNYEHSGFPKEILTHLAIATSLFVVLFTSSMSAYQQNKQKNIHWKSVYVIGLSSAITAFFTAKIASSLKGELLRITFGIIVGLAAIRMLLEGKEQTQKRLNLDKDPSLVGLIFVGLIAGIVSALAGIGGGIFTIPMMYYFLDMPLKLAIGTSSAAIFITAFFSVLGYIVGGLKSLNLPDWSLGFVDLQRGIALAIGTMFFARIGAYVSFKTHPFHLKRLFAIFVVIIAFYIIFK